MYHVLFQVIVTNEVLVTIQQACISLSRHIRKGVLIRWNIASDLCDTAVGCQQFRKKSRKLQRRIMFGRNYFFFHHCVLSYHCVMFQNSNLSKSKRGGTAPPWAPVATALRRRVCVSHQRWKPVG